MGSAPEKFGAATASRADRAEEMSRRRRPRRRRQSRLRPAGVVPVGRRACRGTRRRALATPWGRSPLRRGRGRASPIRSTQTRPHRLPFQKLVTSLGQTFQPPSAGLSFRPRARPGEMLFRHPTHKAERDEDAASAKGGKVLRPELSKISLKPKGLAMWGSFRWVYIAVAATLSAAGTAIAQGRAASTSELKGQVAALETSTATRAQPTNCEASTASSSRSGVRASGRASRIESRPCATLSSRSGRHSARRGAK
jgi:hypothetical protein